MFEPSADAIMEVEIEGDQKQAWQSKGELGGPESLKTQISEEGVEKVVVGVPKDARIRDELAALHKVEKSGRFIVGKGNEGCSQA